MLMVALVLIVFAVGNGAGPGTGLEIPIQGTGGPSESSVGLADLRRIPVGAAESSQGREETLVPSAIRGPATVPSPRSDHDMAYDAESDRAILFGGWNGLVPQGDTWAYDFNTNEWALMNPATGPSPRFLHAMAYDAESDRVILYGGVQTESLTPTNDTWAYDFNTNTWTNRIPQNPPPARWGRMAYDAESDRVILFGGASGHVAVVFNDTWAYDFNNNTWAEKSPRPSKGTSHAMAYDAQSDRIVVYGGESAPFQSVVGTWVYHYNDDTWVDMNPNPRPPEGFHYASDYDAESDRVVLWGGLSPVFVPEVWSYNLNTNAWESKSTNEGPSKRNLHRMVYDQDSDRSVTFGGRWPPSSETRFNNETWAYDLNENSWTSLSPLTRPDAPRNLEATSGDGEVTLSWKAPFIDGGYAITSYRVYRGTPPESPSFLEVVGSSLAVTLTYTDSNSTMGFTYLYVVRAVTRAGEGPPSNEASVTVPDDVAPTVTITSPTEGQTANSSSITAAGTATDNVGVRSVEVSTDMSTWTSASLAGSSWSATISLIVGLNTIHARATDTSGNVANKSVSITYEPPGIDFVVVAIIVGGVVAAAAAVGIFLFRRRS